VIRGTHHVGAFAATLGTLAWVGSGAGYPSVVLGGMLALGIGPAFPPVSWPTLAGLFLGALIGATAPDLDKPRQFWARVFVKTAFGGHRHLSHSLIGFAISATIVAIILRTLAPIFGINPTLPWLGFVAGYLSHLVLDSLTVEGVPWLFPIEHFFGLPPWPRLRVRTGSLVEQFVVMPALLASIGWLGYRFGPALLQWWR